MDIEALIDALNERADIDRRHGIDPVILEDAAAALSTLQEENANLRKERDAAKPSEVLEAVDELMEFARTRMSTADWLYYANVLGEWRGQKEN